MSRTTKTVLFIVVCYLIVGSIERSDYDSLELEHYDGPGEEQLIEPLTRA